MTPNILEAMKWFPTDLKNTPPSYDFTWIDLGVMDNAKYNAVMAKFNNGETPIVFYSPTPPQEIPMPFDKLGVVVKALNAAGDEETMLAVTFHLLDNDMQAIFRHPSGRELILTHVGGRSVKGELDLWYDGELLESLKLAPKYLGKTAAEIVEDFIDLARRTYAQMYVALMDSVKPTPMYAAKPNPVNAKRIRKGKKPLFEWKVIDVTAKHTASQSQEATKRSHASPRRHIRRGHQRKLASGKVVWVKQMWVGKIEFGYIHHSYTTGEK